MRGMMSKPRKRARRPRRLLIVEDDRDMQAIYRYIFKGLEGRYTVRITGEAPRALDLIRRERFDLIISDMIMETMTGDTFLQRLRESRRSAAVPVLVVTVLGADLVSNIKRSGVHYLEKPIGREELLGVVDRIFK